MKRKFIPVEESFARWGKDPAYAAAYASLRQDTQPLTRFRNNSAEFINRLKQTRLPITLTVNGKAAAVLQDTESYQRLLELAAIADEDEGIRQGLEDVRAGRTRPAAEFFEEFRAKHRIPRSPL